MRRTFAVVQGVIGYLFAVSLVDPAPATAQAAAKSPRASRYARAITQARAIVRDSLKANGSPGVSVAVAVDGVVVWEEGYGFADMEQRVPVTPRTKFRIGSVSKSLTSVALGLLVEGGRLDPEAEVQQYAPAYPRKP